MSTESTDKPEKPSAKPQNELANKFSAIGWALFLIWVGVVLAAKLGFGVGMVGVGVIALVLQAARKYCKLVLDGFWIVIGLLLVIAGLWEAFHLKLHLVPTLLIVMGLVLLVSALTRKKSQTS